MKLYSEVVSKKYPHRGDIWMVNLGKNKGSEQNGIRPCIIMNKSNRKERTCVVVPASNTLRKHSYEIENYNFLIHQIRVVDTTRFIRKITRFGFENTTKVYQKICRFLS